jgi:hypothetical protein
MNGEPTFMRTTLLFMLMACPLVYAQAPGIGAPQGLSAPNIFIYRASPGAGQAGQADAMRKDGAPVQGAPYSAAITTESVQTLADGNRIVVKTTGFVARDSLGRSRQQMELPAIGNLSAANVPQMVFIQDPVAQVSYTLNLTDKTAHRMPALPPSPVGQGVPGIPGPGGPGVGLGAAVVIASGAIGTGGPLPPPPSKNVVFLQKSVNSGEQGQTTSEDLGSQVVEGVVANGTRTTLTIPAGQIGNDKPIAVVTEVWISPDLKAVVFSKRSDPRMGEQTFHLNGIQRGEPDASLFAVPPDFTLVDGPERVFYQTK